MDNDEETLIKLKILERDIITSIKKHYKINKYDIIMYIWFVILFILYISIILFAIFSPFI